MCNTSAPERRPHRLSRSPQHRRGSILILVVAVLVLLALMGTAYMQVARIDRLASGPQNDATTDEVIEQLLPAARALVTDVITKDVYTPASGYRPIGNTTVAYDNFDYAATTWA